MLIDTHSHLYDEAFDADRAECIARDRRAGIEAVILPAIDSLTHEGLFSLCRQQPGYCYPLIGVHPTSVNDNPAWQAELSLVERLLENPPVERFYGIGEVGLDLYWSRDWETEQTEVFRTQIELSIKWGLPLVIHTRDAWPQMHAVLGEFAGRGLRGIMHAFSGTAEDYGKVKSYGNFLFGIGGVVTYKKSTLAETVRSMSSADMVMESDAPYLTPMPFRGRRNESGMIAHTCRRTAELLEIDEAELAAITTSNAKKMFAI